MGDTNGWSSHSSSQLEPELRRPIPDFRISEQETVDGATPVLRLDVLSDKREFQAWYASVEAWATRENLWWTIQHGLEDIDETAVKIATGTHHRSGEVISSAETFDRAQWSTQNSRLRKVIIKFLADDLQQSVCEIDSCGVILDELSEHYNSGVTDAHNLTLATPLIVELLKTKTISARIFYLKGLNIAETALRDILFESLPEPFDPKVSQLKREQGSRTLENIWRQLLKEETILVNDGLLADKLKSYRTMSPAAKSLLSFHCHTGHGRIRGLNGDLGTSHHISPWERLEQKRLQATTEANGADGIEQEEYVPDTSPEHAGTHVDKPNGGHGRGQWQPRGHSRGRGRGATGRGGHYQNGSDRGQVMCQYCGNQHNAWKTCRPWQKNQYGHGTHKNTMPKNAQNMESKKPLKMAENLAASSEDWVVTTAVTRHMTWNRKLFSSMSPCGGEVETPRGKRFSVFGQGDIRLGGNNIEIEDVLWVPEMELNLLSWPQIDRTGVEVQVRDGKMKLVAEHSQIASASLVGGKFCLDL